MRKLFDFLRSKSFFANLVLAVIFFAVLFIGLKSWISSSTNHGEKIAIPDLSGYTLAEAQEELLKINLHFEVIDSAEFNPQIPLGSIVSQFPPAGSEVKESRVMLLTINPFTVRKIEIPNIIEKTLRRAIYDLESKGFTVGELTYIPDIAKDVVLKIAVANEEVFPGDKYIKGTIVDLIVGSGLGNELVAVPYLKWLTLAEAELKMKSKSLNLGLALFDEEVTDSAAALVYRQNPSATHKPRLRMGAFVDLWLTNDSTKITNDSLQFKYPNMNVDSIRAYLETDTTVF